MEKDKFYYLIKNHKPLKKSVEIFVETGIIPKSNIKKIIGGKKRFIYHKK
jgi:hypothetical protein